MTRAARASAPGVERRAMDAADAELTARARRVLEIEARAIGGREERRRHRAERYEEAFAGARRVEVRWSDYAVIPAPTFSDHRLVGFEDSEGFVLGLALVVGAHDDSETVELLTTCDSLEGVDTLHVGDVAVNPRTFEDRRL